LKPKEQATFDKYADALFCLYETLPDATSNSETSSVVLAPGSNALTPKKHVARPSSVPALRNVECVSSVEGTHAGRSKPIKTKRLNTRYESETSNCSRTATEKPPSSPWSKKRKFESPTHEVSKEIQEPATSQGSVYKMQNRANAKHKKRKLAYEPDDSDSEWKPGRSSFKQKARKEAKGR
ncbi:hypothetical protein EXIGLDRAFT_736355, partial [Exidia glandulosa HHB12029]